MEKDFQEKVFTYVYIFESITMAGFQNKLSKISVETLNLKKCVTIFFLVQWTSGGVKTNKYICLKSKF